MIQLPKYVEDLRWEVRHLRIYTAQLKRLHEDHKKTIAEIEEENATLRDENRRLKKENEKLKEDIEKLTKTNKRYQVALFDHGNFRHPMNTKTKKKGGQLGHPDTNRESHEDFFSYPRQRLFAKVCGNCQRPLARVTATKQKMLLDIVINPQIVKLVLESERQWCRNCKREINAKDQRSLPFTEYGINTFMMSMVLRIKCHASFANIATVITISHGLSLSKSDVSNFLTAAATYLGKRYDELKTAIREGTVMYNDETGWLVHGQSAWMWIMANERETVYVAAESRGKGIAEDIYASSEAFSMTDGLASYTNTIPEEKHLYCWSHVLRFCYEETVSQKHPTTLACQMRNRLVLLYQTIRLHNEWTPKKKETLLREELNGLLTIDTQDQTIITIQQRLRTQKEGLIRALLVTEDGTNNLAERELRTMAIKRTISYGSDTYRGMETTAIIGSVIRTLERSRDKPFFPTLRTYLKEGIMEKHRQYVHIPYYDT